MFFRTFTAIILCLTCIGCATSSTTHQQKQRMIDEQVDQTLSRFYRQAPEAQDLAKHAQGILIFPSIFSAAFIVGGEYGAGALRIGEHQVRYFKATSGSFGLQAGIQSKAIIIFFMEKEPLTRFLRSKGWTVGLDANITLFKVSLKNNLPVMPLNLPIIGFVIPQNGMMFNVSLQGTKISPLAL